MPADAAALLVNGHMSFIVSTPPHRQSMPPPNPALVQALLEPRRHYADLYNSVDEENFYGRQWASWTNAMLDRARDEGDTLTLLSQSPLMVQWDDFMDSDSVDKLLEWHQQQSANDMARRRDGAAAAEWCFYDQHTAAWVAELKRNGTLGEEEDEVPCPVRAESSTAVLEHTLHYSTAWQADYDREETQLSVGQLEKAVVDKLGWGQEALFFAGASSVLEYPPGAAYQSHTDCEVDDMSAHASNGRIFSLLVYLNEPPSGGETVFDGGISVTPLYMDLTHHAAVDALRKVIG